MAEFAEYLQRLRPSQSYTGLGMQLLKQIPEPNPSNLENFGLSDDFSLDSFLAHNPSEFPGSYLHNFTATSPSNQILNSAPIVHNFASNQDFFPDNKKRKVEAPSTSSSPAVSVTSTKKNNNLGRGRKGKNKEKEGEKADQVIHVRAKRGQATDSHSIAERVRREKINNKLRCLQDLVPGCHKSMGMAIMLEEIINYVHSLQNQVEFLSMELAAASCNYNLNLETEYSKKSQVITNLPGAQETQRWLKERYGEQNWCQSTWSI